MSALFQNYVFASSNEHGLVAAASLETLEKATDELFVVSLTDEKELELLMRLLGICPLAKTALAPGGDFAALFDYSAMLLPDLGQDGFDAFYEKWLLSSGRESTMDEYGQLVFLWGHAGSWNSKSNRFILLEAA